ncbi:hypothetical protein BAY06_03995 [Elizabethkingia anophelis]|uniref:hypothetical protein n=1 Tax=Elizabethkingia anophelis TaxID=1117645 RepID=UPI00099B1540|nr:hypothetical protein [Elizabethkingia anophelis]OPC51499.1 hypothetical protein BAY06_03995 [Elizabethkingia anophelis]
METPKEQAIKAAYGEHWGKVKDYVNENGWCDFKAVFGDIGNGKGLEGIELETVDNYDPKYCYWKRPKSLSGIENNNGWTRIESEEDLPKDDYFGDLFEVGFLDESGFFHHERKRCSFKSLKWMYEKKLITHYQPVQVPKPPIF